MPPRLPTLPVLDQATAPPGDAEATGRVRFVTFGCKANQYDTQVLREALLRRGWDESGAKQPAPEVLVVNTCTVTAEAGRKARQLIRRVSREAPEARIAVTGCLAESEPELLRELPGVEWVFGNGEAKLPARFLETLTGEVVSPEELGIPAGITEFAGHTRAFLKIQDGCDKRCAFCIIPSVRGASRSRSIPELCAEVRRLVEAGHREVVLCGIHIGLWGVDLAPAASLADLIAALAAVEVPGPDGAPLPWRMRLSSIEATEVDDALLELMAARPERIAPHLHMPMQSGSDGVLQAMNRWYTVDEYLASVERIQARLDLPALSADILVGFPGEGEAEFAETAETIRRIGFSRMHVFPFSPRPGTAAEGLVAELGRPDPAAVRERRAHLGELARSMAAGFRAAQDGRTDAVVVEGDSGSGLSGRYERVRLGDPAAAPAGGLVPVRLRHLPADEGAGELFGEPLGAALEALGEAPRPAGVRP